MLASSAKAGDAYNLRCHLRERLVDFLFEHYPYALPRLRAEVGKRAVQERQRNVRATTPNTNLKGARE